MPYRLPRPLIQSSRAALMGLLMVWASTAQANDDPLGKFFGKLFDPIETGSISQGSNAEDDDEAPPLALPAASGGAINNADLANLRQVVEAARRGNLSVADASLRDVRDPTARKLGEWVLLRQLGSKAPFERLDAFAKANPAWPSASLFRRRAEGSLWDDNASAAMIRAYFAHNKPGSAKGRFALAQVLLASGDQAGATTHARAAVRQDSFSGDVEAKAMTSLARLVTRADWKHRMNQRLFHGDEEGGVRAAQRLGSGEVALAKAFSAVWEKNARGGALLEAVPGNLRSDPLYIFAKAQWHRRQDQMELAAQVMSGAPREAAALVNPGEWWIERRMIARKLLDDGNARLAYRVAAEFPGGDDKSVSDSAFYAGWIALRFTKDTGAALRHFTRLVKAAETPISQARAYYWLGRAHEAVGESGRARASFEAGAKFSTAYYGQLSRAKMGLTDVALHRAPEASMADKMALGRSEPVRALEMLYAIGARDMTMSILYDLCVRVRTEGEYAVLAELTHRFKDAKGMLTVGKAAMQKGFDFDLAAYPTFGMPSYKPVAGSADAAVTYAIARQESTFDPKIVSSAGARGLMQMMPATAKKTAKTAGLAFDERKLLSDPAYNATLGAFHLGELLGEFDGAYILTFAAYNAGRSRVAEWIAAYGDPRQPQVDPVDWVERIPFSETRNYVQRVMENMQVYRLRLGGRGALTIEADLRRGGKN